MNNENQLQKIMKEKSQAQYEKVICFDYAHKNKLTIGSSFSDFTDYLINSFKIAQIENDITAQKLKEYSVLIIGEPTDSPFASWEIEAIEQYVKEGGGLIIACSGTGNYENNTNLNDLSSKFGFTFNVDKLFDDVEKDVDKNKPVIEPHYVTNNVKRFTYSPGCSIKINESTDDVKIKAIGKAGLNCFTNEPNGSPSTYKKVSAANRNTLVAVDYYKGRVIGLGSLSMFSSTSHEHGYNTLWLDNKVLLSNVITWLANAGNEKASLESLILSIPFESSLWAKKIVKEEPYWSNISEFFSFCLDLVKENYGEVMDVKRASLNQALETRKQKELEEKRQEDEKKRMDEERKRQEDETRRLDELKSIAKPVSSDKVYGSSKLNNENEEKAEEDKTDEDKLFDDIQSMIKNIKKQ